MESVKFKLDLGNPMLCFMCPKCFGVTHIKVMKHKLNLSTMDVRCEPNDVTDFVIGKDQCKVEVAYNNLVRMVHNCDQNATDREPMVCVNPLLGNAISNFSRLGFGVTRCSCGKNGSTITTKPFIEFNISYDDPKSNDIKNQLSAAIIAVRDDVLDNKVNHDSLECLVFRTMRCDFELMSIGQHLRITCDPLSIDPDIDTSEIPWTFAYALDELIDYLNKSAANKTENDDDED